MNIGAKIIELRKKKGLTQEQLAEKLGISAPAISKWETDTSYPDITLLCPLARALDTNVDTLLQFEESLTGEEITEKVNNIIEVSRNEGHEVGENMIRKLLYKYPNSIALKFNIAAVYNTFLVMFLTVDDEVKDRWMASKQELLLEVSSSESSDYWQTATLQLASIAINEDKLEEAEQLLKRLPEINVDSTMAWSQFYMKKGENIEALKVVQKRLFSLVRQVQTCLLLMMNSKLISDVEQELKICKVYKEIDDLFGLGELYDGVFLEIYLRMKCIDDAADCLERYVNVLTGEKVMPKDYLFYPGLEVKKMEQSYPKEICKVLIKALEEDEQYHLFIQNPKCKKAIEKLKASL